MAMTMFCSWRVSPARVHRPPPPFYHPRPHRLPIACFDRPDDPVDPCEAGRETKPY